MYPSCDPPLLFLVYHFMRQSRIPGNPCRSRTKGSNNTTPRRASTKIDSKRAALPHIQEMTTLCPHCLVFHSCGSPECSSSLCRLRSASSSIPAGTSNPIGSSTTFDDSFPPDAPPFQATHRKSPYSPGSFSNSLYVDLSS